MRSISIPITMLGAVLLLTVAEADEMSFLSVFGHPRLISPTVPSMGM